MPPHSAHSAALPLLDCHRCFSVSLCWSVAERLCASRCCAVVVCLQYHNISSVLRDLKAATYTEVDGGQLGSCKAGSEATRQLLEPVFQRVALVYGHSPLATVEGKVAAVKQIMSASVARALHSVEHLEELEESSERFEEQSRQFHKKTVLVKKQHRKNYWVLGALAAVVLLAVILYFAIPAAIHSSSNSSPLSSSCSSTGMGA